MQAITAWELSLLEGIQTLAAPWLDALMCAITHLGDGGLVWILLAVLLLCRKATRQTGLHIAVAMLFCLVFGNLLLKNLFARPRPFAVDPSILLLLPPPGDWSFPSGHTMHSVAAAMVLVFERKRGRWWALALAVLIGFSRLYLRVHFPSDVLVGALVGLFAAWLATHAAKCSQQMQKFPSYFARK